MDNKKKEPWRIAVGVIAVLYIIFMWVKKDIISIYSTIPSEEVLPLIVTTFAVYLLKVAGIVGMILLVKWIISRRK